MLAFELPSWLTDPQVLDPTSPWTMFMQFMAVGLWYVAYVLIIYRGFKDRSYGMPVTALCANVAWEGLGSFVLPVGPVARGTNIMWFVTDLVILYTCLRYGADDF